MTWRRPMVFVAIVVSVPRMRTHDWPLLLVNRTSQTLLAAKEAPLRLGIGGGIGVVRGALSALYAKRLK